MSSFNTSLHSKVYADFKEIDQRAHHMIVEFYDEHQDDIQRLRFHEYFDLHIAYVDALAEIGAYENLIEVCEDIIVVVIQNNIQYHHGEDIYRKLLLRKAVAHYSLMEYHKAEFVLKELIKMNPSDNLAVRLFQKSQTHHPPNFVKYTRGISLLLFLFTAMIICFEMSYFGFGKTQSEMGMFIEISRNVVFLFGWSVLIFGDGIFRLKVWRDTEDFVEEVKGRKSKVEVAALFSED